MFPLLLLVCFLKVTLEDHKIFTIVLVLLSGYISDNWNNKNGWTLRIWNKCKNLQKLTLVEHFFAKKVGKNLFLLFFYRNTQPMSWTSQCVLFAAQLLVIHLFPLIINWINQENSLTVNSEFLQLDASKWCVCLRAWVHCVYVLCASVLLVKLQNSDYTGGNW